MPLMNSPIPRARQVRGYQGSLLRSVRDSERPDQLWKKVNPTSLAMEVVLRQLSKLQSELGKLRHRIIGGGGSSSSGSVDYAGEYDPGLAYSAKVIVKFTPDGDAAGNYISKTNVPPGISPDVGSIYWDSIDGPVPGMWG